VGWHVSAELFAELDFDYVIDESALAKARKKKSDVKNILKDLEWTILL
jgi:hypothetical protein